MKKFSALFGITNFLIALMVIAAGCSIARSSRFAISPKIHKANKLMIEAQNKNAAGDHLGAIKIGKQILPLLKDSNFKRDEMKYKAAIQRANAWYTIGTAKLFLSGSQNGEPASMATIIPLLGAPKGASQEFEKALSEISDGEQIPHKYRAQINPYSTKARAYMFLGRFQNSEYTFLDSIEWSSQAGNPAQFLFVDYYWRAYSRNLQAYAMYLKDSNNKKPIYQMWSSAIEDMERAKKYTSNPESQKAMDGWIVETRDKQKLVR